MTSEQESIKFSQIIKQNELSPKSQNNDLFSQNGIFNSKLFIDLDTNFSQFPEKSNLSDCETSTDIEDDINNKGCFLIKDLIDELNSVDIIEEKIENNSNNNNKSILSLVYKGYEFIPKNYIFQQQKIVKPQIKYKNNNIPKKGKKQIKERKGDWVCINCNNINFAFRTFCNRCKGKKEECLQRIII